MNYTKLTNNQTQTLNIIHSFKYLPLKILITIVQKQRLYTHLSSLSRSLKTLKQLELIKDFSYGNNWKVLYITKKGAKILALELNKDIQEISIPNYKIKLNFAGLEHTVKIAQIYIDITQQIEKQESVKLLKWIGDQHLYLQYTFRSNRSGKIIKRNLVPDSYFEIEREGKIQKYFLEYDTGSMDREQLSKKFMRYFEYFVYGDWKERFEEFPSILFITERSERALQNLIREEAIPLEKALSNRSYFMNSRNVIWRGIGMSENVRSTNSHILEEFLITKFAFLLLNNLRNMLDLK